LARRRRIENVDALRDITKPLRGAKLQTPNSQRQTPKEWRFAIRFLPAGKPALHEARHRARQFPAIRGTLIPCLKKN
jgi:hypothetical protein